jgi:hypothetical protein
VSPLRRSHRTTELYRQCPPRSPGRWPEGPEGGSRFARWERRAMSSRSPGRWPEGPEGGSRFARRERRVMSSPLAGEVARRAGGGIQVRTLHGAGRPLYPVSLPGCANRSQGSRGVRAGPSGLPPQGAGAGARARDAPPSALRTAVRSPQDQKPPREAPPDEVVSAPHGDAEASPASPASGEENGPAIRRPYSSTSGRTARATAITAKTTAHTPMTINACFPSIGFRGGAKAPRAR